MANDQDDHPGPPSPLLGLGRAALDYTIEKAPTKPMHQTFIARQSDSVAVQVQTAEAALKLQTARLHTHRIAEHLDAAAANGATPDYAHRAQIRAEAGYAVQRAGAHQRDGLTGDSGLEDSVTPKAASRCCPARPPRAAGLAHGFKIWREAFVNDGDLDLARSSYEQLSPEPYQQLVEPLDLRKFYTLDTPRLADKIIEAGRAQTHQQYWGPPRRLSRRDGAERRQRLDE